LSLFKSSILKTISNSLLFLEEYLGEEPSVKILFSFFIQTYASLLAKE
jgi:hypothetical protein